MITIIIIQEVGKRISKVNRRVLSNEMRRQSLWFNNEDTIGLVSIYNFMLLCLCLSLLLTLSAFGLTSLSFLFLARRLYCCSKYLAYDHFTTRFILSPFAITSILFIVASIVCFCVVLLFEFDMFIWKSSFPPLSPLSYHHIYHFPSFSLPPLLPLPFILSSSSLPSISPPSLTS